jgi:diaminopimelate decarboxylase
MASTLPRARNSTWRWIQGRGRQTFFFAGPGKSIDELRRAIATGSVISAESREELLRITASAAELQLRAHVILRINPNLDLRRFGMRMGGESSQFGIDAGRVTHLLQFLDAETVDLQGFHIFGDPNACLRMQSSRRRRGRWT